MNYFPVEKRKTYITLDGENIGVESNELKLKSCFAGYSDVNLPYVTGNAVELDDRIHYLGGGSSGYWKKHYEFDGKQWTQLGLLPYEFTYEGSAVVLNGEIHILGAQVRGGDATDAQRHYKWNGTTWTQVSTLPFVFSRGSAVVLNGEIHIMGGEGAYSQQILNHYKWNGTTWTQVSTLPYSALKYNAVVYNGKIHLLGVVGGSSHYYFDGNEWVSLGETPINNGYAITMNDGIHLLEKVGYGSKGFEHYRWDGEVWHTIGTIPYEPYVYPILYNGRIHLLGAHNSNGGNTVEHKQLVRFVEIA